METYYGAIELFPYSFAPDGWLLCNGTLLPISNYQTLFSLIGVNYGGNGSTNFALPNLQGFEPIPGMQYYIATQGYYPVRP
jgi:microcystin-dependent protein